MNETFSVSRDRIFWRINTQGEDEELTSLYKYEICPIEIPSQDPKTSQQKLLWASSALCTQATESLFLTKIIQLARFTRLSWLGFSL